MLVWGYHTTPDRPKERPMTAIDARAEQSLANASAALPALPASPLTGALANNGDRFIAALERADSVAARLLSDAAERDRANHTPRIEVELLRDNDLLQVREPVAYGGDGLNYAQAAQITRRIARGDTGIAHLIGYHFAQTRIAPLFGTPEQPDAQSRLNAERKLFWGGVQNPRGGSAVTLSHESGDVYRLNGTRTFASGASLGDYLQVVSAWGEALAFVNIPGDREGINPLNNWDNMGQRLTDSGGIELNNVPVRRHEILGPDPIGGAELTPYHTLVTPHWQLAFVNFYIGTAEGAIAEALEWTRAHAARWESSGVEQAVDNIWPPRSRSMRPAACSRSREAAPPPPPMASTATGATSAPTPSTTQSPTRRARSATGC
jgi:alkylation response protein AidB-like acyl-CoA dehydrogenase